MCIGPIMPLEGLFVKMYLTGVSAISCTHENTPDGVNYERGYAISDILIRSGNWGCFEKTALAHYRGA